MNHYEKGKAILFIRPNAEFVLTGDDLEWLDQNQSEPTQDEIQSGWIAYKAKIEADQAEAEMKKMQTKIKLEALGLDEDDLKALGL